MISLDQVLLLQEKVETAVQRIQELSSANERLTSENDALRSKCAELSKALDDKTELVSTLESDQSKIEAGILSALSRLDTVENSVLGASAPAAEGSAAQSGSLFSETADPDAQPSAGEPVAADQAAGAPADTTPAPEPAGPSQDNQFDIF